MNLKASMTIGKLDKTSVWSLLDRLRVVPLFETVKDLREAGSAIRKLLAIDWYREHIIKNHNGHQEVVEFCEI